MPSALAQPSAKEENKHCHAKLIIKITAGKTTNEASNRSIRNISSTDSKKTTKQHYSRRTGTKSKSVCTEVKKEEGKYIKNKITPVIEGVQLPEDVPWNYVFRLHIFFSSNCEEII